jgi:hypothetical protein
MIALGVIMFQELTDGSSQRVLTEKDHPFEALGFDRAVESLNPSVQVWGARG